MQRKLAYANNPGVSHPESSWIEARQMLLLPGGDSDRRPLDAHHLTYERFGHERITDLVLVCRICHDIIHKHAQAKTASIREATEMVRAMRSGKHPVPPPDHIRRKHPRSKRSKLRIKITRAERKAVRTKSP